MLVDARDGRAFDLMTLPVAQKIMRLPPFDKPLPIVRVRPDGVDGKAQLPAVAQMLGLSNRTLARRLTAEGLSFSEILDQLRSDLAAHYLGDASLSISQIAWLVGYQGVSAFSHGCKRWTGMNPKRMRDKLLASR